MSSDRKKKKKTHVPFRMNMLFLGVFLLFSVLVLRLGIIQIVEGDEYKREVDRTEDVAVSYQVPRGKIYDRHGNNIVDNNPKNAITYTNFGASQSEMLEVAERLALLIDVKTDKVRERDKKDFWLLLYPEKGDKKVPQDERDKLRKNHEDKQKEYDRAVYQLKLDRITEEDLRELTDQDIEVCAIYSAFNSGYALTPEVVKNEGVTDAEFAAVSENLEYLPGVDTTTDWNRIYTYGNTLKSILGKVSEGLPSDNLTYYLSRGYSLNDRVGNSYIESQYEEVLSGQKSKIKNITDKAGNVLETEVLTEGQRGKDLILTIDMDLQIEVEKIIEEELKASKASSGTKFLDRAFVVLADPLTGEILTMAGKQIYKNGETGKMEVRDHAFGNIQESYIMGSAVKGASVITGFKGGVIDRNTYFKDRPIKIAQTPVKRSWRSNLGTLNPVSALKVSSNVYMMETAIRIGKGHYRYNQPLPLDLTAWEIYRDTFSQFGLGVQTGIDLPNEQTGFKGTPTPSESSGKLLDFSFGQYDTYTSMQLVQYASTIANGGNRLKPRLVKEIREPVLENGELGPVFRELKPDILNKIEMEDVWIESVQEGFRQVMQETGGTGVGYFGDKDYLPAGKTGTAEDFVYEEGKPPQPVYNLSLVAYAPYKNPEVAMAVVVPKAYSGNNNPHTNMNIGERVLDTYFKLKKERETEKNNSDVIDENSADNEAENEETDSDNEETENNENTDSNTSDGTNSATDSADEREEEN